MAVVGRANIFLGADTAAFTSKMDKARRDMASSATRMNRSLARVDRGLQRAGRSAAAFAKKTLSIRGAIGLLAGTGGLALLVKRSLDAADSIAHTERILRPLSILAVAALGFAVLLSIYLPLFQIAVLAVDVD